MTSFQFADELMALGMTLERASYWGMRFAAGNPDQQAKAIVELKKAQDEDLGPA